MKKAKLCVATSSMNVQKRDVQIRSCVPIHAAKCAVNKVSKCLHHCEYVGIPDFLCENVE